MVHLRKKAEGNWICKFGNMKILLFCFLRERNLFSLFFKNVILFLFISVEKKEFLKTSRGFEKAIAEFLKVL